MSLVLLMLAACSEGKDQEREPKQASSGDSCQIADAYFTTEITKSVTSEQHACTRDEDCTLWSPVLWCAESLQVLNCGLAVHNDALPALELERSRITSETCSMLDARCTGVGVSCAPSRAVCARSVCTTRDERAQVPCSVDVTSSELAGARIHIEADDCRFRAGEAGTFRYRVELPSELAYQLPASMGCGKCANDLGDVSALVVAQVGAGAVRYCPTCDVGCCAPNPASAWTLRAKTLDGVLDWPGRTWGGPSDTTEPVGGVFAVGNYNVDVTLAVPGVGTLTALLPIVVE